MGYQHKAVHEAVLQMLEDIGRYEAERCQYNHRTCEDRDTSQQLEVSNGTTVDVEDQSGYNIR
eukprot:2576695-Amphidinium_carterae.1